MGGGCEQAGKITLRQQWGSSCTNGEGRGHCIPRHLSKRGQRIQAGKALGGTEIQAIYFTDEETEDCPHSKPEARLGLPSRAPRQEYCTHLPYVLQTPFVRVTKLTVFSQSGGQGGPRPRCQTRDPSPYPATN